MPIALPTRSDYQEVLQNPQIFLGEKRLKECKVEKDPMGMPKVRSGGFALTYSIENLNHKWALRCFHKTVPEREYRYAVIDRFLKNHSSDVLVPVEYIKQGVLVKDTWYPVTIMEWVEGDTLNNYLYKNINNSSLIASLVSSFKHVVDELERLSIAHGDLSQLNILIRNGKMILVDYDGMFVPELAGQQSTELGNLHFQHLRRTASDFNSSMDRFSEIVIYLTLQGLSLNPRLYKQFGAGGEGIIFKQDDFKKPHTSKLLLELEKLDQLKQYVQQFRSICLGNLRDVPPLGHFLENRAIEIQAADEQIDATTPSSQFLTISASQRAKLFENDGEYATIIGRITQVHHGFTVKKMPRTFFNFGDFRGQCFTVVLWSEVIDLFKLSGQNLDDYEYKWVAVTGLISTFENEFGIRPQIILETPANIEIISDEEAQSRLSSKKQKTSSRPVPSKKVEEPACQRVTKGSISAVSLESVTQSSVSLVTNSPVVEKPVEYSVGKIQDTKPTKSTGSTKMSMEISEKIDRLYADAQQIPNSKPSVSHISTPPNPVASMSQSSAQVKPPPSKNKKPGQSISNVSQPVKAQKTPRQQAIPKQTPTQVAPKTIAPPKKAVSLWVIIGALLFVIFSLSVLFLPRSSNLPGSTENLQATPTKKRIATAILTEPAQLPTDPPADTPTCISWAEIKVIYEGEITCIYGIVESKRYFSGETGSSYQLIRFSNNPKSFYLTSHKKPVYVSIGDCVSTEAVISYDINGVPFMEISEITRNKYSCTE